MRYKIKLLTPDEAKQIVSSGAQTSESGPCTISGFCSDGKREILCSGVAGETCVSSWTDKTYSQIKSVRCGNVDKYTYFSCDSGSEPGSGLPEDPVLACESLPHGAPCEWFNGEVRKEGTCVKVGSRTYCATNSNTKKAKGLL